MQQTDQTAQARDSLGTYYENGVREDASDSYELWRRGVVQALDRAGLYREKNNFEDCGKFFGNFPVLVCDSDLTHVPKALPFTCHLRFCPDCEHRNQARKLARYIPAFQALTEEGRADFSLKKFELTTPYALQDMDSPYVRKKAWKWVHKTIKKLMYTLLEHELTADEKKRGRIEMSDHGLALLVSDEFGEHGQKLHFHILAYCPYIPKTLLTETWKSVSGGECEITWIKAIQYHDVEDAVSEVAKYVTKFSALEPELIPNLVKCLAGTRRMRTYGVIRDMEYEKKPCACPVCQAGMTIIKLTDYIERCNNESVTPDEQVLEIGRSFLLDLKHGNKTGVTESATKAGLTGLPPPKPPDQHVQTVLPGIQPVKTLNSYDY